MIGNLNEWLDLVLAIVAILAALTGLIRWANKGLEKKITLELREATRQIKTDANGGQSLNDVNKRLTWLAEEFKAYMQYREEIERKRDGQIDELKYEIGIAKRVGAWPNGE